MCTNLINSFQGNNNGNSNNDEEDNFNSGQMFVGLLADTMNKNQQQKNEDEIVGECTRIYSMEESLKVTSAQFEDLLGRVVKVMLSKKAKGGEDNGQFKAILEKNNQLDLIIKSILWVHTLMIEKKETKIWSSEFKQLKIYDHDLEVLIKLSFGINSFDWLFYYCC